MTSGAVSRRAVTHLVTDSTAYLPESVLAAHPGISVVPLQVVIEGEPLVEGSPGSADTTARALRAGRVVTTSRPSTQAFLDAYASAAESGASAVVSVHISAKLSATWEGARAAAEHAPIPVEVIDSQVVALAMGFAVASAADLAATGADAATVAAHVRARLAATRTYFYVDTLEYLRRGGRIGAAAALLGTALAVKPILTLDDGMVVVRDKVRTAARALDAMVAKALADYTACGGRADVAVHQIDAPERAAQVAAALRAGGVRGEPLIADLGGVVGAHCGPGTLAVVIAPVLD